MESDKTWENFNIHFSTSYFQHRQIHGETAATSEYVNSGVAQSEEDLTESLGVFANLASVTASYIGVVATLTKANARLA